jgi:hypothetical protein
MLQFDMDFCEKKQRFVRIQKKRPNSQKKERWNMNYLSKLLMAMIVFLSFCAATVAIIFVKSKECSSSGYTLVWASFINEAFWLVTMIVLLYFFPNDDELNPTMEKCNSTLRLVYGILRVVLILFIFFLYLTSPKECLPVSIYTSSILIPAVILVFVLSIYIGIQLLRNQAVSPVNLLNSTIISNGPGLPPPIAIVPGLTPPRTPATPLVVQFPTPRLP